MQNNIFFLSRSQLEESNKTSFIIFVAIHEFLWILQDCYSNKTKETLTKIARCTPRQAGPTGQRPTRPGQGEAGLDRGVGAATASRAALGVRAHARARRRRTAAARGGATRRGRSRPGEARTAMRRRRWTSPQQRRRGAAASGRRGGERRLRAEGDAGGSARRGKGPGKEGKRRRTTQGSSPCEELARHSPGTTNQRRQRSSGAAAMAGWD